ncbi:hypothetical protein [Duganella callida]|uniref:Uncharacterized protein n=1 Tax=Duganella callida TaxID=2561932 RepID=A0A4Y9S7A1_9BURK|nr:hypothetical protein [Duganella callida]TFW15917.1 hypothetical protein E4L98_24780 [Duganella callida]
MSNVQIAALLMSVSAVIFSCGAMHVQHIARGKAPAEPAPLAPAPVALIEPLPAQRDDDGWYWHPGLPDFEEDHRAYAAWMLEQGLEYRFDSLEDERDDHPAAIAYYEQNACHVRDWYCEPPAGEGWFTLSIHDSESGPQWVWVRRVGTEALMAAVQAEALAYHERYYVKLLPNGQRYSGSTFKNNGEPILLRADGKRSVFCDLCDDLEGA